MDFEVIFYEASRFLIIHYYAIISQTFEITANLATVILMQLYTNKKCVKFRTLEYSEHTLRITVLDNYESVRVRKEAIVDYYILQLNLTWHHERPSHSYDPLVLLK
jgi:hypothetical protein